jgi:rubrerythrin
MNTRRIFEYALQREREGHRFFSEKAAAAGHAAVASIFTRLAEEEKTHIAFIEGILARLDQASGSAAPVQDSDQSFFSARAASELIEQTTAEAMVPDLPVLRMAWLIERDLADFYRKTAAQVEGEARDSLEMLARWEEGHESLFRTLHDRVFAEYAGMPWGG